MSTTPPVSQGVILTPDEDVLYEVVDHQVVDLAPRECTKCGSPQC